MVRSATQQHIAVTLVAIVTTVTTLSVTYHLLRRSQCLSIESTLRASMNQNSPSCVVKASRDKAARL
ncbi:MAG: hypothetical protein ACFB4J_05430 [Elainellaceae cyanobacterium]